MHGAPSKMSKDHKKELLKTASMVEQAPWNHEQAARFLREITDKLYVNDTDCKLQLLPKVQEWHQILDISEANLYTEDDFLWGDRRAAHVEVKIAAKKSKAAAKSKGKAAAEAIDYRFAQIFNPDV